MLLRGGPDGHRRWHDRQSSRQPRIKDGGRGPFHGTDFVSRELQKEKAADMNIMENVFNGLLVWALLVPSPARAEPRYSSSLPPAEYDVPYKGTLTIWRLQSEQAIREMCSRTPFPTLALACSISPRGEKPKSWCYVFIVSDAERPAELISHTRCATSWDTATAGPRIIPAGESCPLMLPYHRRNYRRRRAGFRLIRRCIASHQIERWKTAKRGN
jgi:hypothetical protein